MRHRFRGSTIAVVAAAGVAVLSLAVRPTAGQAQAGYRAPRLVGTTNPDLNGLWQAFNSANWDLQDHSAQPGPFPNLMGVWGAQPAGLSVVEGNEIPYRPEALAKKRENFAKRTAVDPENLHAVGDPEAKCYLPGVPRATYLPFPFQILQRADKIMIAYEFASSSRVIHLQKQIEAPIEFWMGWSNGKWEGDTLVVDVTGFNGLSWFDRAGNFATESLHVVERYTPVDATHLMYEATIEDPKVFTRPWKISMPLYRRVEKNAQFLEFKCIPFVEEYIYGSLRKKTSK